MLGQSAGGVSALGEEDIGGPAPASPVVGDAQFEVYLAFFIEAEVEDVGSASFGWNETAAAIFDINLTADVEVETI